MSDSNVYFGTYPSAHAVKVSTTYTEREYYDLKPPYQRNGGIWTLDKKQLLIDSILNQYDLPKFYFHRLYRQKMFSVIDGRQRLATIWEFIENKFALADNFKYYDDTKVAAGGMDYHELARNYPLLRGKFDTYILPIVIVDTNELELVEDMFLRLNEAVPLNAAEKRNAIGGAMVKAIAKVCKHDFFTDRVKFSNKRYQHRDVAARILYLEHTLTSLAKFMDAKKAMLDNFVEQHKEQPKATKAIVSAVIEVLEQISATFTPADPLLRTQSFIPVLYMVFRQAHAVGKKVSRTKIKKFRDAVIKNKELAEQDVAKANYEFLEFDNLSRSDTANGVSIRQRTNILCEYLGLPKYD